MTELEKEIKEMEKFFSSIVLPTIPIKLNPAVTLHNVPKFVKENIVYLKKMEITGAGFMARLYDLRIIKTLLS